MKKNAGVKNIQKKKFGGNVVKKFAAKSKSVPEPESEDDSYSDINEDPNSALNDIVESDDELEMDDSDAGNEENSDSDVEDEEHKEGEKSSDEELEGDEFVQHKKSLTKLKETDPEFYQFLRENDKNLLQFGTDSDSGDDDEKLHQPPDKLEADSEESDFEPEEGKLKTCGKVITFALLKKWKGNLINEPSIENIVIVAKAFNAALARVKGEESPDYKVEGSAVFNAVIELCIMHMETAVTKFLKLPKNNKLPQKSKKWVKIRNTVQTYLSDLLKLLSGVTSNHIISVLLKHLHGICYLVVCFNKLSRTCLKLMSSLWSNGEESVRVLAYLCILRLTTCFSDSKSSLLDSALKLLYISYVKNTRFVSANTLPQINFMRRSLADLFTINPTLSYQHAFLYIRQLAIHLRNAVTLRKKERFQTVYNWQYINSLHLWVELLCCQKEQLNQLSYPLVTIIIGCIKLIPTAQYIPLRFHCLNMLIKLSRKTDTYIPIFPYALETFSAVNLNMKHKKASMKPFDLNCVLRLSKGAMTESAFTDSVVDNTYQILLDTCYTHCSSISFPDMIVPVVVELRNFIKTAKVSKYAAKFKPLLSKIEENAKLISNERNKLAFNLSEIDKIKAFEANIRLKGLPFEKFWDQWNQANKMKRPKKEEAKDSKIKEEEPIITIRKDLKRKPNTDGPTVLFPSDDESDQEISKLLCGPVEEEKDELDEAKKPKLSDDELEQSENESIKQESSEESELEENDNNDEDVVEELNLSAF